MIVLCTCLSFSLLYTKAIVSPKVLVHIIDSLNSGEFLVGWHVEL